MLAGGEEYFQPPESIDNDSLARFAAWCRRLRALEKPGKQSIETLCTEGDAVSAQMHVKEVVAGTVLRCIKHSSGNKRYAYWCLLDKMAKQYRTTFGFLFEQQLAEVAADCIEWEDAALAPKYDAMMAHWEVVFDGKLIEQVRGLRRQERIWAAQHPEEAKRQREEEEAVWDREIAHSAEVDGLDHHGEPCLEYCKGTCEWGAQCKQLHPPGLEGKLPPEARYGDWWCPGCGMVNRHFRRRCFACVREKPQYKKGQELGQTAEVVAITKAEGVFLSPLAEQFGYDPCDEAAAVRHWRQRLATPAQVAQYIEDRRRRYQSEILPHMGIAGSDAATMMAAGGRRQRGGDVADVDNDAKQSAMGRGGTGGAASSAAAATKTVEINVPAAALTGSPLDRMTALTTSILEEGVHSPNFLKSLFLLSKVFPEVAAENSKQVVNDDVSLLVFEVTRMVHTAWLATGRKRPHAAIPFLGALAKHVDALPLTEEHKTNIKSMAEGVA